MVLFNNEGAGKPGEIPQCNPDVTETDTTADIIDFPRPRLDWSHIRTLGSLPDNVYMLPVKPPEDAA
jgi:hypothetical protein